jgi:hypothetical protein
MREIAVIEDTKFALSLCHSIPSSFSPVPVHCQVPINRTPSSDY